MFSHIIFHHVSSSCVNVRLLTCLTCLEVPVGGGGGCGGLESEISDRLWLEPSLGQAEQYGNCLHGVGFHSQQP